MIFLISFCFPLCKSLLKEYYNTKRKILQHFGNGLNTFVSRWGYFIAENILVHKMCIIRTNAVIGGGNGICEG